MSHGNYVWQAIRNYAAHLVANCSSRLRLPKKAENPFKMGYNPELNTSPELEPDAASYFQTIIDILKWMIELGKITIVTKMSLLSSCVVLSEWDVGERCDSKLVYNPSYQEIDHSVLKKCDWSEFYQDAEDTTPMNAPKSQVKEVLRCNYSHSM